MNLIKNIKKLLFFYSALCFISGCSNDDHIKYSEEGETIISISVRAAAASINTDQVLWEDRVDELRMLAFDSGNGEVAFNEKIYFPNGFAEVSRPVKMYTGTYNFYFIANETVYTGDFVDAILEIQNESEFSTDPRFTSLNYNPDFVPDENTTGGRFIMSAVYTGVDVVTGGTETNPLPLPISTGRVELVRALAKVEVIFRKKVSGSTVPDNTVTSVLLENVASNLSIPPLDDYYNSSVTSSPTAGLTGLDYGNDSIGSVVFFIPELLVPEGSDNYTVLEINNNLYPIETDDDKTGITLQRRTVPELSDNSIIRNYHYIINAYIDAEGGLLIETYVEPWKVDNYTYIFQGDQQITIPPVTPTDSSIIIVTECGKVEILSNNEYLSQGLQGAYNDVVNYYDPEIQGPVIYRGDPPYYCEKKYGENWRLINSCELLSFLAVCDAAYNVWTSNTWLAAESNMPYYSLRFRQSAQALLESLTGEDLSSTVLYPTHNNADMLSDEKVNLIDLYFTPGDIMLKEEDFPNGWPYEAPPGTDLPWYYNEVTIQVKAYWYGTSYLSPSVRANWDTILYNEFERYDYSSTVSRCVRTVE